MTALANRWTTFRSFLRSRWLCSRTEPGPKHPCGHRNISETSQNNRGPTEPLGNTFETSQNNQRPVETHLKHIWNIPKQLEATLILVGKPYFLHHSNWLCVLPWPFICAPYQVCCISTKNLCITDPVVRPSPLPLEINTVHSCLRRTGFSCICERRGPW